MKTTLYQAALATLLVGTAAISVQADEERLMLAESGSDRVMEYHLQREALANRRGREDSSERFVQMIREQPTAAGPMTEEQTESMDRSRPAYKSPIQRDREMYGK